MPEIRLYEGEHGRTPFSEWLGELKDRKGRAIIKTRLDRVSVGNFGNCRAVGHGVFELIVDFGPGYRIYFGLESPEKVVLLCGGDKGTQRKDIALAKKYWLDWRKNG